MAATGNRIRRTERETRDRKWLDSGFFFVFAGGKWGDDGRSAWAKRWKKRWDLLTHDHGVRREKRRVVEIVVVSRPTTRAVNLMSVPLRDRDGTWWCGRRAGKSLGDSLGYSGGGACLGENQVRLAVAVALRCPAVELPSIVPGGNGKGFVSPWHPAGNASMALQWQLAYSCPRLPGGWIGYDWRLSHYLDW